MPADGRLFLVPALCVYICVGELSPGWILSQPRVPWVEEAYVAQERFQGAEWEEVPALSLASRPVNLLVNHKELPQT